MKCNPILIIHCVDRNGANAVRSLFNLCLHAAVVTILSRRVDVFRTRKKTSNASDYHQELYQLFHGLISYPHTKHKTSWSLA